MRSPWRISLVVLSGSLVLAGASAGATVGGRVAFSVNGNAVEFSGGNSGGQVDASVALQDGDVVLVGGSIAANSTFFAAELQPDGSLDPGFGVDGVEHVEVPLSPVGVLREPDGKLLVLATGPALSKFQWPQLMVVRLDANGTLDQTYGVDGVTSTGLEDFGDPGAGAISADGELLVSGTTGSESTKPPPALSNIHWVIEELTSAGTLDPAFGRSGAITIAVKHASGDQLAVEPDGDIVADGVSQTEYPTQTEYLTRLTAQGAEDPTFAAGRPVAITDSGGVAGMLVQPDGSITLLDGLGLERYTTDGTLDQAFGSHGVALVPALVAGDGGDQLLPGPGSDVLVASYPQTGDFGDDVGSGAVAMNVAGVKSNGVADKSISATLYLPFGGGTSSYYGPPFATKIPPIENSITFHSPPLLQRADGSYLVVGTVGIFEPAGGYGTIDYFFEGDYFYDFAAAAFAPTFAPDTSFGTTPTPPPRVTLRLPAQRAATDLDQDWIGLKLEANVLGLVDITIRDRHGAIAQTAYPLLHSGTQTVPIELTSLGKRELSTRQAVPITIQASVRDLLATTATTSIHATLG
jgi:uncharacterized delta-60 repeat protein